MKKLIYVLPLLLGTFAVTGCSDTAKTIVVGATPSPHAEILACDLVQNYIKEQGYTLIVKEYQDYITPNKALNDGAIDANYFQHIPYLNDEIAEKGYKITAAAKVHYEPLNLYSTTHVTDFSNRAFSIVNDLTNAERAFNLLVANGVLTSFDLTNFDPAHPVYASAIGATVECIDPGLLHRKVEEGGLAVIPGNYALTAWGSAKAIQYRLLGETEEVAGLKANVVAVRTEDKTSDKINVLCAALAQSELKTFFEETYGPTVVYSYQDVR